MSPVYDRLSVGTFGEYDGTQYNEITHMRQAKTNDWAARLLVELDFTDSLTTELNLHGGNQDNITPGLLQSGRIQCNHGRPVHDRANPG